MFMNILLIKILPLQFIKITPRKQLDPQVSKRKPGAMCQQFEKLIKKNQWVYLQLVNIKRFGWN